MVVFPCMRWTIFVKLPVALSGGSSANSSPLAGAMLFTTPCTTTAPMPDGLQGQTWRIGSAGRRKWQ
jgi:hypothetical protein